MKRHDLEERLIAFAVGIIEIAEKLTDIKAASTFQINFYVQEHPLP